MDRFSLHTLLDCYEALEAFPQYHNHQRIHMGRACKGRTPDEAFPQLPRLPELPEQVNPSDWLKVQHGRIFRRRIRSNGSIQIDKHLYYVDEKLAGQAILLHLDAQQRCLHISLHGKRLTKVLPLKGLHDGPLDLQHYLSVLREEAISIAQYRAMLWMQSGDAA